MRVISAEILEVDLDLREPTDLPFEAGQWISVPFGPKNVRAYSIASTPLPKIGPGLKATLASYGIETAADVASRTVSAVPGFGATRTKELLLWRQSIERGFAFDPTKGIDPADVQALDLKFASRRQELEQELRQGQPQLYGLRAEAEQKRSALTPQFLRLAQTLEQAKADAKVA